VVDDAREPWMAIAGFMAAFLTLMAALLVFQRRHSPHPELPRKLLHAGSGLLTLSFPFLFAELWPVLVLTGGSALTIAAIKFLRPLRRPLGGVVDGVSRTTLGEIYFPIAVAIVFWLSRGKSPLLFCIPILVLTVADATCALVGMRYGQTRFAGANKSFEGSVAFLVVAFFCIHVPLLLWSDVGRVETLLISLTLALLVMLLEGSAWRGLDNLFIPIGGFFLLQAALPLGSNELFRRFFVTLSLVVVILASRRSTTMLDDSLLAGAFLCYVTWALAGWRWLVPPVIGYVGFSLYSHDAYDRGRRFHTVAAMLAIWAAAVVWLALSRMWREPAFVYPFTLVFAAHIAIFGLSRMAHRHSGRPLMALAVQSILQSWVMFFLPYIAVTGVTLQNLALALLAGPAIAFAVAAFVRTEPGIRDTPQTLSRWARQAASAAAGSALGWIAMTAFDSFV
jgi:phytol kinase